MRYNLRILFALLLAVQFLSVHLAAQSDIGIRFTTSDYNHAQLEFRKKLNENFSFRLMTTVGAHQVSEYWNPSTYDDSVLTMRYSNEFRNYYDVRFGLNRNLKWNYFSVHADLAIGYSRAYLSRWNSYRLYDSIDGFIIPPNYMTDTSQLYPAQNAQIFKHYISTGLSLGISFDYPLSNQFILSFSANYSPMFRFQFKQTEVQDDLNEFEPSNEILFHLYGSAGIGLRYVFEKKEKAIELDQ